VSELVDGEGREIEDAIILGVHTILEALLKISQRPFCSIDEAIFLVKAKCQVLRSTGSSEFFGYRTSE
jgi:hypothetical protein